MNVCDVGQIWESSSEGFAEIDPMNVEWKSNMVSVVEGINSV